MTKLIRTFSTAALAGFVGGCAHLPDVTVGYYLAESKVSFKIIRTVACDENNNPKIANSTIPTVTHSADRSQFVPIHLSGLKGTFSDTDVKFDFYEDGRLKNINSTSTGQGEAILKTVVTIATAALAVLAVDDGRKTYPEECARLKKAGGGKPLTLIYEGEVDIGDVSRVKQEILPDTPSKIYADDLKPVIGSVCAFVEGTEAPNLPATYEPQSGNVLLKARQPGWVQIKVMAGASDSCKTDTLWEGKLTAAQFGTSYSLPIPPAAAFGKQVFGASFSESGAITSVQYVSNTGAGQVLNVTSSALTALQPETTAQKASAVRAEADLIAQQQRLVKCLADRTNCQ